MSEKTDSADAGTEKYFLEDRERWESLGFDWQGWNATIEKILQQCAPVSTRGQQADSGEGLPG